MNPRLDVRHLQMMIALEETGSVAEAAHLLSVTPSALSHRIREAERRLDMLLVERAGRGVRLTPGAEHLAEGALRVLDELERLETDVASLGRDALGNDLVHVDVVELGINGRFGKQIILAHHAQCLLHSNIFVFFQLLQKDAKHLPVHLVGVDVPFKAGVIHHIKHILADYGRCHPMPRLIIN